MDDVNISKASTNFLNYKIVVCSLNENIFKYMLYYNNWTNPITTIEQEQPKREVKLKAKITNDLYFIIHSLYHSKLLICIKRWNLILVFDVNYH